MPRSLCQILAKKPSWIVSKGLGWLSPRASLHQQVNDHLLERAGSLLPLSFGVVYRARHLTLETQVAVKILRSVSNGGTEILSPIDSLGHQVGKPKSEEAAEDFRRADALQWIG